MNPLLYNTMERTKPDKRLYFFVLMIWFDVFAGLFPFFVEYKVSSFSLMQIIRIAMIFLLLILNIAGRGHRRKYALFPVFFILFIGVFVPAKEMVYGGTPLYSVAAYLRVVYWLLILLLFLRLDWTEADKNLILKTIMLSALFISVMVVCSIATGNNTIYEEDGAATSGGYRSGKSIALPCAIGGLLWLNKAMTSSSFASFGSVILCFIGVLFSFNRSGQVALVLALCWVFVWTLFLYRPSYNQEKSSGQKVLLWLLLLLIVGIVGAQFYKNSFGFEGLTNRWNDITLDDTDSAGSGRGALWKASWSWLTHASFDDFLFGGGYSAMINNNFRVFRNPFMHAHSDLFDLLYIGGLCGILIWLNTYYYFIKILKLGHHRATVSFCFIMAVLVAWFVSGLCTSSIFGPLSMNIVLGSIFGLGLTSKTSG